MVVKKKDRNSFSDTVNVITNEMQNDNYREIVVVTNYLRSKYTVSVREASDIIKLAAEFTCTDLNRFKANMAYKITKSHAIRMAIIALKRESTDRATKLMVTDKIKLENSFNTYTPKGEQKDITFPHVKLNAKGYPCDWDDLTEEEWQYFQAPDAKKNKKSNKHEMFEEYDHNTNSWVPVDKNKPQYKKETKKEIDENIRYYNQDVSGDDVWD